MRPISLTLMNFIGIASGLGKSELELNLDAVTNGAQLVALVGPNGTGKSTVLDNLHPYRVMPSRAGGNSPGSFSFYDHVHGPEARKELLWEHNGSIYRSNLVFKQTAKTKKTEAYLHQQMPDGWEPVVLPDNTVSDGKTETYDRCVEHIIGSADMFFTAAFSAQGRKSLSSYSNGDIKGLLSELLGLEYIRELGGRAKEVAKGITLHLDAMRVDLARIGEQEASLSTTQAELENAQDDLTKQEEARTRSRLATGEASRNLAEVQADANANTETEIRRQDLNNRIEGACQRRTKVQQNAEQDVAAEEKRRQNSEHAIREDIASLTRQVETAESQISRNRALLGRRDEVENAKAELPRLQQAERESISALESARATEQKRADLQAQADRITDALATLRQTISGTETQIERNRVLATRREELDQARNALPELQTAEREAVGALECARADEQKRADLQAQANRITDALAGIKREGKSWANQCTALHARSALTGEVPCQGTDLQGRCKLLAEAVAAQDQIPAVERETDAKRDEYRREAARLEQLHSQFAELGNTREAVGQRETDLENVRRRIREIEQILALEQSITQAEEFIAAAQAEIEAKREQEQEHNVYLDQLRAQQAELGDTRTAVRQRETDLEDARRQLRNAEQTAALERSITQAEEAIAAAETQIEELRGFLSSKNEALSSLVADSNQTITAIQERAQSAECEIAADIAKVEHELSLLPPPSDTTALEQAQQALEQAERAFSEADQQVTALNARIGTLRERTRGLEQALDGSASLKDIARRLEDEIAQWAALSKAFGNDGIVALTIDDAGPTLAALTNDLLLSCYGPRFSVAIRTQAETAKGDMRETFDIVVFDAERGDEKSVRAMSGGERIWINEALTRAMALYQAQASGQQYECLFADESDGALDPERKQQFMRMKREVLRLGEYRQEFFISHTPELWDMADAIINLEDFRS